MLFAVQIEQPGPQRVIFEEAESDLMKLQWKWSSHSSLQLSLDKLMIHIPVLVMSPIITTETSVL